MPRYFHRIAPGLAWQEITSRRYVELTKVLDEAGKRNARRDLSGVALAVADFASFEGESVAMVTTDSDGKNPQ